MRVPLPHSRKGRALSVVAAAAIVAPATLFIIPASNAVATATMPAKAHVSWTAAKLGGKVPARSLLRASDVPGYRIVNVDKLVKNKARGHKTQIKSLLGSIKVTPQSCIDSVSLTIPAGYRAQAHRVFRHGVSEIGPYTGEVIARFRTPAAAHAALDRARASAAACSSITATTPYGNVDISVTEQTTTVSGADEAAGYAIDGNLAGFISASGSVVAARHGRTLVIVGNGGLTAMDFHGVEALTGTAVGRL